MSVSDELRLLEARVEQSDRHLALLGMLTAIADAQCDFMLGSVMHLNGQVDEAREYFANSAKGMKAMVKLLGEEMEAQRLISSQLSADAVALKGKI